MRDIANKVDNTTTLAAVEFNGSVMQELENSVTKAGITLDPVGGPDTDNEMLAQALTRTGQGATSYSDSGVADAYVLTAQGGFTQPSAYTNGMRVAFKTSNANTGVTTVNVSTLGVATVVDSTGTALTAGAILANVYYTLQYDLGNTRFELIDATTTIADATTTVAGKVELGTQAELEAETAIGGTGASLVATPATMRFHPGVAKGWVVFNGTGTLAILDSDNVISVTDNGVGDYTINWDTDFSSANYCITGIARVNDTNSAIVSISELTAPAAGAIRIKTESQTSAQEDFVYICVTSFGDQ